MKSSPSETKARRLGVVLVKLDRVKHTVMVLPTGSSPRTRFVARFFLHKNRSPYSYVLNAYAKSISGAWQAALRWAKKLERGELK